MKKIYLAILGILVLAAIPAVAFAGPPGGTTGRAQLHPANQSGVKGVINFAINGALTVDGSATGMDPNVFYVSLIYDNGSRPGGPGSPAFFGLCEPTSDDLDGKMFIGIWAVDGDGNGTLVPIIEDPTVSLSEFDTVSIRDTTVEGPFGPGSGPKAVAACGQVANQP